MLLILYNNLMKKLCKYVRIGNVKKNTLEQLFYYKIAIKLRSSHGKEN